MENFGKLKNKLKTAKGNLTKAINVCSTEFNKFDKSRNGGHKKRQEYYADYALDLLEEVQTSMGKMRAASRAVIDEIDDMGVTLTGGKGETPESIKQTIEAETETYEAKYHDFEKEVDDLRQLAEAIHDKEEPEQTEIVSASRTGWKAFRPNQALKPQFLEKESSHLEVSNFVVLFTAYIQDGYQGMADGNPINIHLQPLVDPTWMMSLIQRGLKDDKTLEQVITMITNESNERNPLHARRMQMLRIKKSGSHSDFLSLLEQHSSLIDFPTLTCSSLVMHLFLEQSDSEMAKLCQEILCRKPEGDLALLRQEIKRVESSVWYGGNKNQARYAQADRWCTECKVGTHSTEQCWGVCSICNRRGHRKEDCRTRDPAATAAKRAKEEEEKKKVEIAAAKKAAKNKKLKVKRKAKEKAAAEAKKAAAGSEQPKSATESSSGSEEDSPMKASSARLAKVGMSLGSAKRAILTLEDELQNMSAGQKEEFGDSVFAAKTAKASSSPVFQAEVFNSRTSTKGKTEDLCADTGCSKPIIGATICREQKIPIKPLSNNLTITDASGVWRKDEDGQSSCLGGK